MRPPVKVGIVSVGQMGQYHMEIYSELYNVDLVGSADCDLARVTTMATRYLRNHPRTTANCWGGTYDVTA
jgi:predicted dehydrogenase